ncbi:MAG: histidinol-phosphate aminotransferase family protein, partial [Planctomycetes bacterium]|nr:histidinol-phosphate aminotransferase family protein [Planctomycetota bacterium]
GLIAAIAAARGLPEAALLVGGGSSALIFLALPRWLPRGGRLLVLDPSYGEYAHVAEVVCGAHVARLALRPEEQFRVDLAALARRVRRGVDLVVIVRPNNPTGSVIPRGELEEFLRELPRRVVAWIDEAYVDYLGDSESLEAFAVGRPNVVVCKSLSKGLALSGARAAYLAAAPERLAPLRALVPPWAVSLPAQFAAIRALGERAWYRARWRETPKLRSLLREELSTRLRASASSLRAAAEVRDALPNALLVALPADGVADAELIERCARHNVFVRELRSMGVAIGTRWVRVSVVPQAQHVTLASAIARALQES